MLDWVFLFLSVLAGVLFILGYWRKSFIFLFAASILAFILGMVCYYQGIAVFSHWDSVSYACVDPACDTNIIQTAVNVYYTASNEITINLIALGYFVLGTYGLFYSVKRLWDSTHDRNA